MSSLSSSRSERVLRLLFVVFAGLCSLFQAFQATGFLLNYTFMEGYATGLFVLTACLLAALVLTLLRRYLPAALLTLVGSVGITAVGFALSHPVTNSGKDYISGIPEGVFWKFFAPTLLLLIPIILLTVDSIRKKKAADDAVVYEKQF